MSEPAPKELKDIKQTCLMCHNDTNHAVLAKIDKTYNDEETDIALWVSYKIIECKGCDAIYFRKENRFSEDIDYDHNGNPYVPTRVECFPEEQIRIDGLYLRDDVQSIPEIIQTIYRETVSAVQRKLFTLSGIGVRTIVEATCRDLKAKKRSLEDKIDELVTLSLLTPAGSKILHSIRELGNEAAHEIKAPTEQQIIAAMKVVDHLLLGAYVLPEEAKVLPQPKSKNAEATPMCPKGTMASNSTGAPK